MINFAHRGASSDYPENTLLAFEEGIKCGASGIELDVQKTKDNKIVVIHDEEVERTFKGKGLVKDFTLRELKELQTRRALFEGVQGTGIPTLEEVLNLIRNSDVILNIELKTDMIHYAGIEQDVINMIEDYEMKERVRKHQASRPIEWKTYEIYKDIYKIIKDISEKHQTVILDCITLLVNNLMFTDGIDIDNASEEEINELEAYIQDQIKKLMEEVKKTDLYFVMVTNEIGLGVVPGYKLGRVYCDFVGRINQMLGKLSDEVYFVVCGIPTKIKG